MPADIYNQMLDKFGATLKRLSIDSDEKKNPKGRGVFMTSCKTKAVNFDRFKDSIARKYELSTCPRSCDALYLRPENEWFLIEFKNGKINKFEIRGKIFESLLLLTEKLDKTIAFTREKLTFILVYNKDTAKIDAARIGLGNQLFKNSNSKFFPFGLDGMKKLYFKEVYAWTKEEFDSNFVKKYCAP
jgi:hypothetical protein